MGVGAGPLPAQAPEEPMQGVRGRRGRGLCEHNRRRSTCKECGPGKFNTWEVQHSAGDGAGREEEGRKGGRREEEGRKATEATAWVSTV